jgi:hypothetical protein
VIPASALYHKPYEAPPDEEIPIPPFWRELGYESFDAWLTRWKEKGK